LLSNHFIFHLIFVHPLKRIGLISQGSYPSHQYVVKSGGADGIRIHGLYRALYN